MTQFPRSLAGRRRLAADEHASPTDLARLLRCDEDTRRVVLVRYEDLPDEATAVVVELFADGTLTPLDIANSKALPAMFVDDLFSDVELGSDVRLALANNPRCSPDRLVALAADSSNRVRFAAARHHATPQEQLAELCSDTDDRVATKACGAFMVPTDALCVATRDPRARVARAALRALLTRFGDTSGEWTDSVPVRLLERSAPNVLADRLAELCASRGLREMAEVLSVESELTVGELVELADRVEGTAS